MAYSRQSLELSDLLSLSQVYELLRDVPYMTIRNAVYRGWLRCYIVGGRYRFVHRHDALLWAARRRSKSAGNPGRGDDYALPGFLDGDSPDDNLGPGHK